MVAPDLEQGRGICAVKAEKPDDSIRTGKFERGKRTPDLLILPSCSDVNREQIDRMPKRATSLEYRCLDKIARDAFIGCILSFFSADGDNKGLFA